MVKIGFKRHGITNIVIRLLVFNTNNGSSPAVRPDGISNKVVPTTTRSRKQCLIILHKKSVEFSLKNKKRKDGTVNRRQIYITSPR